MPSASPDRTDEPPADDGMTSPGSRPGAALAKVRDKVKRTLTENAEQKEQKKREELERDEWCRKEKHYRELDQTKNVFEDWIEGDKVVREYGDGSCVVRKLSSEEKDELSKTRSPSILKLAVSRSRSQSPS